VLSGLALGAVGGGLKLLAFLFAPALALAARRPLAWVAACLAVPLALLGAGGLGSLDVLLPLRLEAPLHSSGNVPFVLGLLGVDLASPAVQGVLSAALVAALGAAALGVRSRRAEGSLRVAHALALLLLTFLLASRKSYTSYLVTGFFPLCLSVAAPGLSTRTVVLFGALGTAAVVEPSAWFRWLERRAPGELLAQAPAGGPLAVAAFLLLEGVLLAGYLWLLVRTWRALRCGGEVASPAARAVAW
jgi:hypothetical protein